MICVFRGEGFKVASNVDGTLTFFEFELPG